MRITRGKIEGAQKVVIYGVEGIGKSTFASKFPDPLFIDTEGSTKHLDVTRFDPPQSWSMLMQQVDYVLREKPCETLVIDTMDWAEKLCMAHVIHTYGGGKVKGIEDFGYGKGYTYLAEEVARLLNRLSDVIEVGVNVVLTAHSMVRKFERPDDSTGYDRYELKMERKTSPLVKEWADMLLFANYDIYVVESKSGRGKGHKGDRVMFTTHQPAWDAKNRHELQDKLPLKFEAIAHIFNKGPAPARPTEEVKPPTQTPQPAQEPEPEPSALMQLLNSVGATTKQFLEAISDENKGGRGFFPLDTQLSDLPDDFLEYVVNNWNEGIKPFVLAVMAHDEQLSALITDGMELGSLQDQ